MQRGRSLTLIRSKWYNFSKIFVLFRPSKAGLVQVHASMTCSTRSRWRDDCVFLCGVLCRNPETQGAGTTAMIPRG